MVNPVGRPTVPLFALIIGIDDYPEKWKLSGAVADAKAIRQYLEDVLRVPQDHILTLYNDKATRSAIIQAFKDLRDDERVNEGDPIVIFYSGHGQRFLAPDAWASTNVTECMIPYDCGPNLDCNPIPDRTIGTLIGDIAKARGDNITVIFDCCFSGSLDRDLNKEDSEEGYVPRIIDLDLHIPDTLDADIWGSREATVTNYSWYDGLRSHVLLAACDEKELAYERKGGGGLFTSSLLEKLKGTTLNDTTYTELIERIQLKKQHPQCRGINQHRFLFNARVDVQVGSQAFHPVQVHQGGKYVVKAGSAHGILHGVELIVYDDSKTVLAVIPVGEDSLIGDFESMVPASIPIGMSFIKLGHVGKPPLYVAEGEHFSLLETVLRAAGFPLVDAERAKLEVAMEDDQIIFKVLDKLVRGYGQTQLPYKATVGNLVSVLNFAARYYWFLGLANPREQLYSGNDITVDFYRLEIHYDDFGEPLPLPCEPETGLCLKDPISGSYVIDFVALPDTHYGTKLTNNTTRDLYLNVFLFNNSNWSVVPYYIQSTAGALQAPLKKGESFTIGYGLGGTPPFSYSFAEDQNIDVGYLKIFFATRPIDLSHVVQKTPFSHINARGGTDGDDIPRGWGVFKVLTRILSLVSKQDTWFTLDIPVVQRRCMAN